LPGVTAADLNVDLRDDSLTLTGAVASFEGPEEEDILIEYEVGTYYRQVSLSEVIDQGKIDAQLSDGVLRLSLPKIEKASPRKITVKAG
jgi:HSP20 family protein